jgi:hypothetical protein
LDTPREKTRLEQLRSKRRGIINRMKVTTSADERQRAGKRLTQTDAEIRLETSRTEYLLAG